MLYALERSGSDLKNRSAGIVFLVFGAALLFSVELVRRPFSEFLTADTFSLIDGIVEFLPLILMGCSVFCVYVSLYFLSSLSRENGVFWKRFWICAVPFRSDRKVWALLCSVIILFSATWLSYCGGRGAWEILQLCPRATPVSVGASSPSIGDFLFKGVDVRGEQQSRHHYKIAYYLRLAANPYNLNEILVAHKLKAYISPFEVIFLFGIAAPFILRSYVLMRQWVNPETCPRCGYDRRGISTRCPECGLDLPNPIAATNSGG